MNMFSYDGFAHRCFDINEHLDSGRVERLGNVIIGLPQGQSADFEQEHTFKEWQRLLRQVLTLKELFELSQQLGRTLGTQTYFYPRTGLDYKVTVETRTPYETESGKRLWIERPE
jgi:hypothetical protein